MAKEVKRKTFSDIQDYLPALDAMSLWDYAMQLKGKKVDPHLREGDELYYPSKALNILHDVYRKQYLGLDLGDKRKLELAGPEGPNLSPGSPGGLPGYSMKYTWGI